MIHPTEVEQKFISLERVFEQNTSTKYQWIQIGNFLHLISSDLISYRAYLEELIPRFPTFESLFDATGMDPDLLSRIIRLLQKSKDEMDWGNYSQKLTATIQQLREVAALLHAWTGELEKSAEIFTRQKMTLAPFSSQSASASPSISDNYTLFKKSITGENEHSNRVITWIEFIESTWQKLRNLEKHSVLIPLVEQNLIEFNANGKRGSLNCIKVRMEKKVSGKQLRRNYKVHKHQKTRDITDEAVIMQAVQELYERVCGSLPDTGYDAGVSLKRNPGWVKGQSADAAITFLLFNALLEETNSRKQVSLNHTVAMTGGIDEKAGIKSVDAESLKQKMEAVFFSWADYIVVPAKQKVLAEKFKNRLQKQFGRRQLTIIGIEELSELLNDRRLTNLTEYSYLGQKLRLAWRHRTSSISMAIIVILLFVMGYFLYVQTDQNPVSGTLSGSVLQLKNKYDVVIKELSIGSTTVQATQKNVNPAEMFKLVDINRDSVNEIIWSKISPGRFPAKTNLTCQSIEGDSIIWQIPLQFDLTFRNNNDITTDTFKINNISVLRDKAGRVQSIIAVTKHQSFFPSVVLLLDAQTGKEKGRYVHIGYIREVVTMDVDQDTEKEIILMGQNNAFALEVVLAVLDQNQFSGHGPLKKEYQLKDVPAAKELHYLKIPQTIVGRAFRRRVMSNSVHSLTITVSGQKELIKAGVYDFYLGDATKFEIPNAYLYYYFDKNLEPVTIGTSTHYDLWARNLHEEGRIPFEPDYQYFEAFKDSIAYWDGEKFVKRGE